MLLFKWMGHLYLLILKLNNNMVVINDAWWDTHGIYIKQAILQAYPELPESQIINFANAEDAMNYCRNNLNVEAFIRSTTYINMFHINELYPRVLFFHPMGSNSFIDVNRFTQEEPPKCVLVGAGDEEGCNNTGYGKGLEFWDWDLYQSNPPSGDQSSYSNGIILGKMLKIKHALNCNWWEARWRARATADRTEPNRVTWMWDLYNGYGRINVQRAIEYKGFVPQDPYIIPNEPALPMTRGLIKTISTMYGTANYLRITDLKITRNTLNVTVAIYKDKQSYLDNKKSLGLKIYKYPNVSLNYNNALYELLITHPELSDAQVDSL